MIYDIDENKVSLRIDLFYEEEDGQLRVVSYYLSLYTNILIYYTFI